MERDPNSHQELRVTQLTMQRTCRNSRQCQAMMEYEPGWRGRVDSYILEEAFIDFTDVHFRNITTCRTHRQFRNPDLDPGKGNNISFGIFLEPKGDHLAERLMDLSRGDVPINHFRLCYLAPTPLAVNIETKTNRTSETTQIANWVRTHFRQLDKVVKSCLAGRQLELPILPVVFVRTCGELILRDGTIGRR